MSELTKTQTFTRGIPLALYTVYTVLGTIMLIPGYIAYFAVPRLRPNPKWTFQQAIVNHLTGIFITWLGVTEYRTPQVTAVKAGAGELVNLKIVKKNLYDGLLADEEIQPQPVPAIWVPYAPRGPLQSGQFLTIHFHGGAYVALSPSVAAFQNGARRMAQEFGGPVLLVDYRLSCNPKSRFPAALQDAITAYKSILEQGYTPDQIVLSGDSAGGHLVLSLLRFIAENEESKLLPAPLGGALWSPWCDMTEGNESIMANANYGTDYLSVPLVAWAVREFVPPGMSRTAPYFSPANHPFRTTARLFFQSGTSELLSNQHHRAVKAFSGVAGNVVELDETLHGMHDIFASGDDSGFYGERDRMLKAAHKFFQS